MWSAKLIDHISGLLCKFAVLADNQNGHQEVVQEIEDDMEAEEMSEYKYIE